MHSRASLIPPKVLSQHKHLLTPATKGEFLRLMDIFLVRGCVTIEEAVTETLYRLRVSPIRVAIWMDWQRHAQGRLRAATYEALLQAGILEHAIIALILDYAHHTGWVSEHPPPSKWELRY